MLAKGLLLYATGLREKNKVFHGMLLCLLMAFLMYGVLQRAQEFGTEGF